MLNSKYQFKKTILTIITIFILTLLIAVKLYFDVSYMKSYESSLAWVRGLGLIGWITLVWSILSWKSLRNETICLYIIFITLLYLFTFGQSLLATFKLVSKRYDLLDRVNIIQLIYSQLYTLICLVSFHLGALVVCRQPDHGLKECGEYTDTIKSDDANINMQKAIMYTGIVLLVFSLPGFIFDTINTLTIVINEGYRALYGYDGNVVQLGLLVRIFRYTSDYFIPSLICLLVVNREKIFNRRVIIFALGLFILNALYIGGRSNGMVLLLVLTLIYHYCIKPIDKKRAILLGISGYIILSFLGIVAQLRGVSGRSFLDYVIAFKHSFGKGNLFVQTLSEMGITMFPLTAVIMLFPESFDFLGGKSYLYALTSIIPNLGFWDIHPAKVYAGGGDWLMDTLNLYSGPGFTLIADAFRNFGWYGFFVLLGFGFLFGRVYSLLDKSTINYRPDLFCVIMIFFNATLMCVRGDNLYIVRPLFFVVIPIYILIRFIYNTLQHNGKTRIKTRRV